MILVRPSFQILDDLDPDRIYKAIERAGRTCYKSEDKITENSAEKFIRMILKRGHESVIEHEKVSVRVICDRGVSHEIVRHRIASYSQESTRYCDYNNGHITFVIPPWVYIDVGTYIRFEDCFPNRKPLKFTPDKKWYCAMMDHEKQYKSLRESGWKPEQARSVLPNSLKTEIVMTANLREWRHFFRLRASSAAHPQMREIAVPLLSEFKCRLPAIFEDINPEHSEHYHIPINERN